MKAAKPQHPSRAELIALTIDELPAERAEEVREHLLDCEDCLAQVRELLRLPEAPASPELAVSDEDQANAWQRLQARIAEEDRPAAPLAPVIPMPAAPRTAAPVRNRFREWSGLLAAAVLGVVVGGLLLRGGGADTTIRPLTRTQFQATDQTLRGSTGEAKAKEMKCPQKGGAFEFLLPPSGSGVTPAAIHVRIRTARGEEIAESGRIEPDGQGVVLFPLALELLADGKYELWVEEAGSPDPPTIYLFSVFCPR